MCVCMCVVHTFSIRAYICFCFKSVRYTRNIYLKNCITTQYTIIYRDALRIAHMHWQKRRDDAQIERTQKKNLTKYLKREIAHALQKCIYIHILHIYMYYNLCVCVHWCNLCTIATSPFSIYPQRGWVGLMAALGEKKKKKFNIAYTRSICVNICAAPFVKSVMHARRIHTPIHTQGSHIHIYVA